MTGFIIAAAVIVVASMLLLLRTSIWQKAPSAETHRKLSAGVYREQIEKLEQDRAADLLDESSYQQACAELQKRIVDETSDSEVAPTLRSPKATIAVLVLVIPLLAVGLYVLLGNPSALDKRAQQGQPTMNDVNQMISALEKKLAENPNNPQGWAMLARSYKVLGRSADAEKAFERAGPVVEGDPQLLAIYADLVASNANGNFAGKPLELIHKSLNLDPNNMMALWLLGSADFQNGDFKGAIKVWEHLKTLIPPEDSEDANTLQGSISEAYAKLGKPVPATQSAGASASQGSKAVSGATVSGTVELAPALIARATPDDTVMVIARAPGSRMPVAVLRKKALELPLKFTLDDSLAMGPMTPISKVAQVEIEARVSKTGQAQQESGDLISAVQTVKVGSQSVKLQIDKIRP